MHNWNHELIDVCFLGQLENGQMMHIHHFFSDWLKSLEFVQSNLLYVLLIHADWKVQPWPFS